MTRTLAQRAGGALAWRTVQQVAVQAIYLSRLVVLAVLLDPEDFGLYAIAMAAVNLFTQVTDFGMVPALVQHDDPQERHFNAAWTIGLMRAFGVAAVVVLAAPWIAELFHEPRAVPIVRAIALRPLIEAAASIKVAALTRELRFRALAWLKIPEALATAVVSIALAPAIGVWALIAGTLSGPLVALLMSYVIAPHRPRPTLHAVASRSLVRFGRWVFVVGLMTVGAGFVLRAIISRQLGTAELGLYFMAARLGFLPSTLAHEIVGAVAFPLFARVRQNTAKAVDALRAIFTGTAALIVPGCALIFVLVPSLVDHVLPAKWAGSSGVLRLLVLASAAGLLGQIFLPLFYGLGRPERVAALEIVQTAVLLGAMLVLVKPFGLPAAGLAWIAALLVSQGLGMVFVSRLLPRPLVRLARPAAILLLIAAASAVTGYAIDSLLDGLAGVALAGGCGSAVAAALLAVADRWLAMGLTADLSRVFPFVRWPFAR